MNKTIACIGAGYVGGPTMAMIAAKCPDYKVNVLDINEQRIESWNSDELPIYEPGLLELVKETRNKNLFFSTDIKKGIQEADIIFLAINTPTKTSGGGAGCASDLCYFEKGVRAIKEYANSDKIIIEKSTVPVKTADCIKRLLADSEYHFDILSNPEFLAEGSAVRDMLNPDRILIGGESEEAIKVLYDVYAHWVPEKQIITTNLWSSELSKLTANAFLAQRISSINSISALCEKTGADVQEISKVLGADTRIGPRFLYASLAFGGSCFKKDILNLVYLCRHFSLPEVADYWEQVVKMNDYQKRRFAKQIVDSMFGTVNGKKIAILGYAFKANTGDTRETPALDVVKYLNDEKAEVWISDPQALPECRHDMESNNLQYEFHSKTGFDMMVFDPNAPKIDVNLSEDPYKAIEGAHAVAICTEWQEYKKLDWQRIYDSMEKPAFVFDGRIILDHDELRKIGFNVYSIGK